MTMRFAIRRSNLGCLACVVLLSGCASQEEQQRIERRKNLLFADHAVEAAIDAARYHRSAAFTSAHLRAMIGPPDYVLSFEEFMRLYDANKTYQEFERHEEEFYYLKALTAIEKLRSSGYTCLPDLPQDLNRCAVWMYDETRHYSKPCYECWHRVGGFYCFWFYVQDDIALFARGSPCWTKHGPALSPDPEEKENPPENGK